MPAPRLRAHAAAGDAVAAEAAQTARKPRPRQDQVAGRALHQEQSRASAPQVISDSTWCTAWGANMFRRFCKLFSESFTGCWAVPLPKDCCPSKQGELLEHLSHNLTP